MKSDMLLAVMQLSAERNLPQESVVSAFEDAIAAAYRRDPAAEDQDVTVQLDPESGEVIINTVVHVVDEIDEIDPRGQISVDQATFSERRRPAGRRHHNRCFGIHTPKDCREDRYSGSHAEVAKRGTAIGLRAIRR